jgi:hypothetical protein
MTMPHTQSDVRPDDADAWLEQALVADGALHRDSYVDDDGFTTKVMGALPAPAALPRWRKPALAGLWTIAGVGIASALPGTMFDVAREAFRLVAARPFALSEIAAALLVVGIATGMGTAMALRKD